MELVKAVVYRFNTSDNYLRGAIDKKVEVLGSQNWEELHLDHLRQDCTEVGPSA